MEILPTCSHVNTMVWLHHLDFNKTLVEKAACKLHKNAAFYFEQIQGAAPNKTTIVWPFTAHLTNSTKIVSETCWGLLKKKEQTDKQHLPLSFGI